MNELEEKLNKMIDAQKDFYQSLIQSLFSKTDADCRDKIYCNTSTLKQAKITSANSLTVSMIEVIDRTAQRIMKEHPTWCKCQITGAVVNELGYPYGDKTYRDNINWSSFNPQNTFDRNYNHPRTKTEKDDAVCLIQLGFPISYVAAATGIYASAVISYNRRNTEKYSQEEKENAYKRHKKYLDNVAALLGINIENNNIQKSVVHTNGFIDQNMQEKMAQYIKECIIDQNRVMSRAEITHALVKRFKVPLATSSVLHIIDKYKLDVPICHRSHVSDHTVVLAALKMGFPVRIAAVIASTQEDWVRKIIKREKSNEITDDILAETYGKHRDVIDVYAKWCNEHTIELNIPQTN